MKLPQSFIDSPFFMFESAADLIAALGPQLSIDETSEINRLSELGLPPIVSRDALAVMIGVNPGLVWSFEQRPARYYRHFRIAKGKGYREISAPRVALKIIQKWLSVHFSNRYQPPDHVFGFVRGRSHLQAASVHCGAKWVFSVDVRNFFPSTSLRLVEIALQKLGYNHATSGFLAKFFCLSGGLAQGAPTSPVLSNVAFSKVDDILLQVANQYDARLSRYADDIVFSGVNEFPAGLPMDVGQIFRHLPWQLAPEKTETAMNPQRLKVHGLLVHGDRIRLTKGYRNRIRAYQHLVEVKKVADDDLKRVIGHLKYAQQVSEFDPAERKN